MFVRVLALLICCLPSALVAQDWDALQEPGAIALMRHALAPGTGDPAGFTLGDCTTQRNLDARGRDQARRAGVALRAQGIGFDHVWSSGWCRSAETAQLMDMGPVDIRPSLHSFFTNRGAGAAQSQATLDALAALPQGAKALLVTHQVNITALTGIVPASGEIIVLRRLPEGGVEVSGRVNIAP